MTPDIKLSLKPPPISDFIRMRAECGWGEIDTATAEQALAGGLVCVTFWAGKKVAGFGRAIGDGILYFFLEDIIVAPEFRGKSLGSQIVKTLLAEIENRASNGAMVMLMAATGKEPFYEKLGFTARPNAVQGAGMCYFISKTA